MATPHFRNYHSDCGHCSRVESHFLLHLLTQKYLVSTILPRTHKRKGAFSQNKLSRAWDRLKGSNLSPR
jgi:hypothetical protein